MPEFTRRQFFRSGLKIFLQDVLKPNGDKEFIPIRPPGAIDEEQFLKECEKCGQCAAACPHNAIQFLGPETGLHEKTPFLKPNAVPCRWCPEMPCIKACPSGALTLNKDQKIAPIGRALINMEPCLTNEGILCDDCATVCPSDVGAIKMFARKPQFDLEQCVGCGLCAFYCEAPTPVIKILPPTPKDNSC